MDTAYQEFIYKSRYSRWLQEENRREDWSETVDRYVDYMKYSLAEHNDYSVPDSVFGEVREAILNFEVLPSMRALMTAGPALERNNIAAFNCAFVAVDDPRAFDEMLLILMHGTGVGYSVERRFVSELPKVPHNINDSDEIIVVEDSKEGWAKAYRKLVEGLYSGVAYGWDMSGVRPAGARLKTFGGRASGPEPLDDLFAYTVNAFRQSRGRNMIPIEVHGIACKIAEIVVVGGVRRAAMICLNDLDDMDMRDAKAGSWWEDNPHFRLANNSAVYESKPSESVFWDEWEALKNSGSGERGIFSRYGIQKHVESLGREDVVGVNPCAEIALRSMEFCNLSTVIVSPEDTPKDIYRKARLASIIGTWQSTLTRFDYIRDDWNRNCDEERLLGVSMTGIFGNKYLNGKMGHNELVATLENIKSVVHETNHKYADEIGINRSAAMTAIKPEGTVSQLTNRSSGMHPWYANKYIRTVRGDNKDPLGEFLHFYGVDSEPDIMAPDTTTVFSFPIEAPEDAITESDLTAIGHLEMWAVYSEHYTDHNPSITVKVEDDEWEEVGKWVYDNFDKMVGVSFLPADNGTYKQAPYQLVDDQEFEALKARTPKTLPWEALALFEASDHTTGSQEYACSAGDCEITTI